jgi:hypothetical protein
LSVILSWEFNNTRWFSSMYHFILPSNRHQKTLSPADAVALKHFKKTGKRSRKP